MPTSHEYARRQKSLYGKGDYRRKIHMRHLRYKRRTYTQKPEIKWKDTQINSVIDNTGDVVLLNGLTQGTTAQTRIGRKAFMKYITVNGYAQVTPTTGLDQVCRIMFLISKDPNGLAPTIGDILQTGNVESLRNMKGNEDYKILKTFEFTLNASAKPGSKKLVRYFRKLNFPTDYALANNGNITDIEQNAIYMITLGTLNAGNTAGNFVGNIRIGYTDI